MVRLEGIEFPSKYLNCYESVLIAALKYMGASEETPLVGTQAYFVFREADLHISPRFNGLDEELKRIHGMTIETLPVASESDLRNKIVAKLDDGMPVCSLVDIYFMSHTPHYNHLHQNHYVDIFGYDDGRYYIVCPYYRFMDWVDSELIHIAFFSPALRRRRLFFVPELKLRTLSSAKVHDLARESCQNMLGLAVPETLADVSPQTVGLAGIITFSDCLQKLMAKQGENLPRELLLNLSRQIISMGYSRYWFHKLIQSCQQDLLPADAIPDLEEQFASAAQSWRAIGIRLSAGVHGHRPEMVEHAARQLGQIYEQEERLFNSLLGALPDYEEGRL